MPSSNRLNPARGRSFQKKAAEVLAQHFGVDFRIDYSIAIGTPPKEHKFDLVSVDQRYIGECKNYSWTESGNVPSAKMGFVNEAVFYLLHLPRGTHRFVVMRRDTHLKRSETLAEYYYRTYRHLLDVVFIVELDVETGDLKEFGRNT
jgi:hypothetical protein